MASLILTIVGPDRPGLVRALSEAVAARGGNWQESRMARLGGQFAGIALVEAPESLLADLPSLERGGVRITGAVAGGDPAEPAVGPRFRLEVVGHDRPGIVHDVSQILADRGVNIEALTTEISSSPFSGEALFRATIVLRAAGTGDVDRLSGGLERLSNEMMVDIAPLED